MQRLASEEFDCVLANLILVEREIQQAISVAKSLVVGFFSSFRFFADAILDRMLDERHRSPAKR